MYKLNIMEILRLRELLTEKKMSGKDLAEKINVTPASVSNIVQGNSFPKPETLLKIAEVLDVDVRDLFISTKEGATEALFIKRKDELIKVGELIK